MDPKKILVMGVSGCGKSSVGSAIAKALNLKFFDGDDYHSELSVEKMRQGIPLTDEDRIGWLQRLNSLFLEHESAVIACSALKPEYRDILRNNNQDLAIVYLQGDYDTIWARLSQRANHYFHGEKMLKSQFDTLIEPEADEAIFVDVSSSMEEVLEQALQGLRNKGESA
ncbi:gluconokinase [Vibrio diazotrophicus]|jgi:gluconokinase|uniref:Gluconokinase n=1 Tax=Vibrio diazotrophicus TaxID=685 RepID=A0A2J8GJY2_VIBDI|nr:gluconokinase [Vibrio diazotrophicus]PNH86331.1 gluconate kinase [Vibrio diazotrophicus]RAS63427.1 gluconokinase [Vibrio diazotrophicus]